MSDVSSGDAPTGVSVQSATQSLSEQATSVKQQGSTQLRTQIDERTTQAGQEIRSLAGALRRSGSELEGESGGSSMNQVAEGVADRLDRVGEYLEGKKANQILHDAERFARQQPWLVAGAAAAVGFAASRLLKASSESRFGAHPNGDGHKSLSAQSSGASSIRSKTESTHCETASRSPALAG